jgi:hypothetical protein
MNAFRNTRNSNGLFAKPVRDQLLAQSRNAILVLTLVFIFSFFAIFYSRGEFPPVQKPVYCVDAPVLRQIDAYGRKTYDVPILVEPDHEKYLYKMTPPIPFQPGYPKAYYVPLGNDSYLLYIYPVAGLPGAKSVIHLNPSLADTYASQRTPQQNSYQGANNQSVQSPAPAIPVQIQQPILTPIHEAAPPTPANNSGGIGLIALIDKHPGVMALIVPLIGLLAAVINSSKEENKKYPAERR